MNMVTHIVGGAIGIVALVLCVVFGNGGSLGLYPWHEKGLGFQYTQCSWYLSAPDHMGKLCISAAPFRYIFVCVLPDFLVYQRGNAMGLLFLRAEKGFGKGCAGNCITAKMRYYYGKD